MPHSGADRFPLDARSGEYQFNAHRFNGTFPVGIDNDGFARTAEASERNPVQRMRASLGDRALIIGVDRLDYSKELENVSRPLPAASKEARSSGTE